MPFMLKENQKNMSQIYIQCFIPCNFRMMNPLSSLLVQLPDPHKKYFDDPTLYISIYVEHNT